MVLGLCRRRVLFSRLIRRVEIVTGSATATATLGLCEVGWYHRWGYDRVERMRRMIGKKEN